jgi:GAF domain-containing protein
MNAEARLQAAIQELTAILFARVNVDDTLETVTNAVQRAIPACVAASITLVDRGRPTTPVSTNQMGFDADQAQYESREGPCLSAIETEAIVSMPSIAKHAHWPKFRDAALGHGLRSSLSLPLMAGEAVIGALNLYADAEGAFADSGTVAEQFAAQAAITLANAQAFGRADALAKNLEAALEHRDVIGQAKGILMGAAARTSDEAFDILRRASQRSNRKLYDVAEEIVARRGGVDHAAG